MFRLNRKKKERYCHGNPNNIPTSVKVCKENRDDLSYAMTYSVDPEFDADIYHEKNANNPVERFLPTIGNLLPVSSTCDTVNISNRSKKNFFFDISNNIVVNVADNILKVLTGVDDIDDTVASTSFEERNDRDGRSTNVRKDSHHFLLVPTVITPHRTRSVGEARLNSCLRRSNSLTKTKSLTSNPKQIMVDKPPSSSLKKAITSNSALTTDSNQKKDTFSNITTSTVNTEGRSNSSSHQKRTRRKIVQKKGIKKRGTTVKESTTTFSDQSLYQHGNAIRLHY